MLKAPSVSAHRPGLTLHPLERVASTARARPADPRYSAVGGKSVSKVSSRPLFAPGRCAINDLPVRGRESTAGPKSFDRRGWARHPRDGRLTTSGERAVAGAWEQGAC